MVRLIGTIRGAIPVALSGSVLHSVPIHTDRTPDEIWQRMRWREDSQLYKTVVDWRKVVAGVAIVALVAAAILLGKGRGGGGHTHRNGQL